VCERVCIIGFDSSECTTNRTNNNATATRLSVYGTVQNFDARAHADPSEVSERSGNGVLFRHGTVVLV
jgi:hypothetical protein